MAFLADAFELSPSVHQISSLLYLNLATYSPFLFCSITNLCALEGAFRGCRSVQISNEARGCIDIGIDTRHVGHPAQQQRRREPRGGGRGLAAERSEERSVGSACVSTCRSRSPRLS